MLRQERRGPDGPRGPGARRGGQASGARRSRRRNQAEPADLPGRADDQGPGRQGLVRGQGEVETQVFALREALKGSDTALIQSGMTTVMETLNRVAAAAYQAASAAGEGAEGGAEGRVRRDAGAGTPVPATRRSRGSSRRSRLRGSCSRSSAARRSPAGRFDTRGSSIRDPRISQPEDDCSSPANRRNPMLATTCPGFDVTVPGSCLTARTGPRKLDTDDTHVIGDGHAFHAPVRR